MEDIGYDTHNGIGILGTVAIVMTLYFVKLVIFILVLPIKLISVWRAKKAKV